MHASCSIVYKVLNSVYANVFHLLLETNTMLCSVMLPLYRQQVNVQSCPVPTPHSPPPMFGD